MHRPTALLIALFLTFLGVTSVAAEIGQFGEREAAPAATGAPIAFRPVALLP